MLFSGQSRAGRGLSLLDVAFQTAFSRPTGLQQAGWCGRKVPQRGELGATAWTPGHAVRERRAAGGDTREGSRHPEADRRGVGEAGVVRWEED